MSAHVRSGLIAFAIAFGVVLIYGAMDIFFDPPVDVPSVGYFGYWMLVKAVLVIGVSFGFVLFAMVCSSSWLVSNIKSKSVKIGLLVLGLLISIPVCFLVGYELQNSYTRCVYPLPPNK
jgi:hypothetical protein